MENLYETIYPPKYIFLNPEQATWDWDKKGLKENIKVEFPSEGGIYYYPDKNNPKHPIFKGFPNARITDNVAIFKRCLILKIKKPYQWIFYKDLINELNEIAYTSIRRYYLKPQYYCKSVREIYRLCESINLKETWIHNICMIFQWDTAYRYRMQLMFNLINFVTLSKNPIKEINKVLKILEKQDNNERVRKLWRLFRILFNIIYTIPKYKKLIKKVVQEIKLEEFIMDDDDKIYAYKLT